MKLPERIDIASKSKGDPMRISHEECKVLMLQFDAYGLTSRDLRHAFMKVFILADLDFAAATDMLRVLHEKPAPAPTRRLRRAA